jgi:hypothetical protein
VVLTNDMILTNELLESYAAVHVELMRIADLYITAYDIDKDAYISNIEFSEIEDGEVCFSITQDVGTRGYSEEVFNTLRIPINVFLTAHEPMWYEHLVVSHVAEQRAQTEEYALYKKLQQKYG